MSPILNPAAGSLAVNPYENFRGPDDPVKWNIWAQQKFDSLINRYPELKRAYEVGDLVLKDVSVIEPYGYQTKFIVRIKNTVISEWWKFQFLYKPDDQRGTKTGDETYKIKDEKRRDWMRCYLDKQKSKVVHPYVFSFSKYWSGAKLTNGGHRITHSDRVENVLDPNPYLGVIDFDYLFPYYDLEDGGKLKVVNLKGCNGVSDIAKVIGYANWKDKLDSKWHNVDLYDFNNPTEEEALEDHSEVFLHSNSNLDDIDLIHADYTEMNKKLRPVSDWKGWEEGTVLDSLKRIWNQKKYYTNSVPYSFLFRSLLIYTNGLVDNSVTKLFEFNKDKKLYKSKDKFEKFTNFITKTIDYYLRCKKLQKDSFPNNATRMIEFVGLMTVLKSNGDHQIANIINTDKFIVDVSDTITDLYAEAVEDGRKTDSFYDARSRSSSERGLKQTIGMILSRLIDKGSVVLVDHKKRNISPTLKKGIKNICDITGQRLNKDNVHFHHKYIKWAHGGASTEINSVPVLKDYNLEMEKLDMTTSEYIEMMLSNSKYRTQFTETKLKFWENGGLDELKSEEGKDKYRYGISDYTLEAEHKTRLFNEMVNPPLTLTRFMVCES